MGTYTSNQNFYLIGTSDFIDVDTDLNYNWDRADERIRGLVEYQRTDAASISVANLPREVGYKFYKTYTNSLWNCQASDGSIYQDPNAQVDSWSNSGISYSTGYTSDTATDGAVSYSSFNGWVHLRGRILHNSGAAFPTYTGTQFMTLPASVTPTGTRDICVSGGDDPTNYQYFQIAIDTTGKCWFTLMGATTPVANQNFLPLNEIMFPINTTVGT